MKPRYDPDRHHRRSIRLKGYDYTQSGVYYITVVTVDRDCMLGEVVNDEMTMSDLGRIVRECWTSIPEHFQRCSLDAYVVMPNHVHGILVIGSDAEIGQGNRDIEARRATHASPLQRQSTPCGPARYSIGSIIGSFKSAASRSINRQRGTPGSPVWQRSFFEHVIRNEESLERIRLYVAANPAHWLDDEENPAKDPER